MSTMDQSTRERKAALDLLGSVESHPTVQSWLREIDRERPKRRVGRYRGALAAAAGVLLAMAAVVATYSYLALPHYATRIGEQRDVLLPDGSRVTLNTNTSLTVRYSKSRRYIELTRGEALFSVKHDSQWPFDVTAGGILTRALGTEFNVDLRQSNVTVSVLEGAVQVAAPNKVVADASHGRSSAAAIGGELQAGLSTVAPALAKGEAVEIRSGDRQVIAEKADLQRIDAWRMRRLEFSNTPLRVAVEEFNRYSRTRVVIGSPELETVRVSGVFQIGDTDGFLYSLKEALRIQAFESKEEVTLVRNES